MAEDMKGASTAKGLETMSAALPDAVGYHRWIVSKAEPFLGRRVLEVGGGSGIYTDLLKDRDLLVAVDLDAGCAELLRSRFSSCPSVAVRHLDLTDHAAVSELRAMDLDSAICFNVIEHVAEEGPFLAALRSALVPGGRLVVTVPAHSFLYGSLDRAAGHFRRYTAGELEGRLKAAGFKVLDVRYFNSLGAVGWFVASRVIRQKKLSSRATAAEIRFFDKVILPLSKMADPLCRGFFGQSLIGVAESPPA